MTQVILSLPNKEVDFLSSLAQRMGWKMETKQDLLSKFIDSCPKNVNISDEEIQEEISEIRYKR